MCCLLLGDSQYEPQDKAGSTLIPWGGLTSDVHSWPSGLPLSSFNVLLIHSAGCRTCSIGADEQAAAATWEVEGEFGEQGLLPRIPEAHGLHFDSRRLAVCGVAIETHRSGCVCVLRRE